MGSVREWAPVKGPLRSAWSFGWRTASIGSRVVGSMHWREALSVLSQRLLILEEEVSADSGRAFSLRANSSGTGMFALIVTPTFTSEAALLPPDVATWKELMTFLKNDSQGSGC